MRRSAGTLLLLLILSVFISANTYRYQGKVADGNGKPIADALVGIPSMALFTKTDASGNYVLEDVDAAVLSREPAGVAHGVIEAGVLNMNLLSESVVGFDIFRLNGSLIHRIPLKKYGSGRHAVSLFNVKCLPDAMYLVKLSVNGSTYAVPYLLSSQRVSLSGLFHSSSGRRTAGAGTLVRASAAGYRSSDTLAESTSETIDFTLDVLAPQETGTSALEDGSADRMAYFGNEQYFWGDPGTGQEIPLVKIVTAVSDDAVDIALVFNPGFVDNTYGTGVVGWKKHTFVSLVKSDHVELSVRNGDNDTVFFGKIDMISVAAEAPSGYATLGPYGGDGTIAKGSDEYILSFGTSMDDNLNYYGYELLENSPETDSFYSPNTDYPNWEYYAIYRISFDPALFGESGYGDVQMTSVHASPAKTPQETVIVTEGNPPNDTDDPFTKTPFGNPPTDTTDNGENPPTDPPDDGENPPGDTNDDGEDPPTDPIDTQEDVPPSDTTDTTDETPPQDVME